MFTSSTDEHAIKRHHALTRLIQQEADRRGSISFARFMELALYAPGLGFYEHRGKAIGRRGDFFTSVSVGPLFGDLLACQFIRWLGQLATSRPVLVEAGAHDGRLAFDILSALERLAPQLFERFEYWLLEPSLSRQNWQRETLKIFQSRVRWFQSWTELSSFHDTPEPGVTGAIIANELLDAMPVHRLRWSRAGHTWQELSVRNGHQGLEWFRTVPDADVAAYAARIRTLKFNEDECPLWPRVPASLLEALPDGFTIEVSPATLAWWQQAAQALDRGWLLTLDYGLAAQECFAPHRSDGTVRGYYQHQLTTDLLARSGQLDLTAHVNFAAVQLIGEAGGLATETHCTQGEFLTNILRGSWPLTTRTFTPEQVRQFQTLTHPNHLGRSFRALVQSRGVRARS